MMNSKRIKAHKQRNGACIALLGGVLFLILYKHGSVTQLVQRGP